MIGAGVTIAVVIPTRNRAALAIAACDSLVNQTGCRPRVFVSDNSTEPDEARRLSEYCAASSGHVTYLRPTEPLSMATHWNWAIRTAMDRSDATHFIVHYDRRVTKAGHLRLIGEALAAYPGDVVCWMVDQILKDGDRSFVWQTPWSGRLYAIETARVVELTAKGTVTEMGQSFPFFSNCAVPRSVLATIQQRFGDICDSTAPDSCFTYRFCATHSRYLHFDRTVAVVYASERSAGFGFMRGTGGDFPDFRKSWGDRPWISASPIPGLDIGQNILFHEYELVRRATQDPAFMPIEMDGYLRELARALSWVKGHPGKDAELRAALRAHGWTDTDVARTAAAETHGTRVRDGMPWVRRAARDVGGMVVSRVNRLRTKALVASIVKGARPKRVPDTVSGFHFSDDREALRLALAHTRKRTPEVSSHVELLRGVDVTPPALQEA